MFYRVLADLVVAFHGAFIAFVVLGGLLVVRWYRLRWIHLPMVLWAALVELAGWRCPLTPLENRLRRLAGEAGYDQGFIEHYLWPLIYPSTLTRDHQVMLAGLLILINVGLYALAWRWNKR